MEAAAATHRPAEAHPVHADQAQQQRARRPPEDPGAVEQERPVRHRARIPALPRTEPSSARTSCMRAPRIAGCATRTRLSSPRMRGPRALTASLMIRRARFLTTAPPTRRLQTKATRPPSREVTYTTTFEPASRLPSRSASRMAPLPPTPTRGGPGSRPSGSRGAVDVLEVVAMLNTWRISGGEAGTALGPPPCQQSAPTPSPHADAEAVCPLTPSVVRLIRALAHDPLRFPRTAWSRSRGRTASIPMRRGYSSHPGGARGPSRKGRQESPRALPAAPGPGL